MSLQALARKRQRTPSTRHTVTLRERLLHDPLRRSAARRLDVDARPPRRPPPNILLRVPDVGIAQIDAPERQNMIRFVRHGRLRHRHRREEVLACGGACSFAALLLEKAPRGSRGGVVSRARGLIIILMNKPRSFCKLALFGPAFYLRVWTKPGLRSRCPSNQRQTVDRSLTPLILPARKDASLSC